MSMQSFEPRSGTWSHNPYSLDQVKCGAVEEQAALEDFPSMNYEVDVKSAVSLQGELKKQTIARSYQPLDDKEEAAAPADVDATPHAAEPCDEEVPSFPFYIIDEAGQYCFLEIDKEYVIAKQQTLMTPKQAIKLNYFEMKCGHCQSIGNKYFPAAFALAIEHRFQSIGIFVEVMAVGDNTTHESHEAQSSKHKARTHDHLMTVWLNLDRVAGQSLARQILMRRNEISDLVVGPALHDSQPVRFMMARNYAAKFFENGQFNPATMDPRLLECVLEAAPKKGPQRETAIRVMYITGYLSNYWREMLKRMNYPPEILNKYPVYGWK